MISSFFEFDILVTLKLNGATIDYADYRASRTNGHVGTSQLAARGCDGIGYFIKTITTADGGASHELESDGEYGVQGHVKEHLRKLGFVLPLDDMGPWIRLWDDWMSARGDFYDYRDQDGWGGCTRCTDVLSIRPCACARSGGSLLLNKEIKVVCEDQGAFDQINTFFSETNFMTQVQDTMMRATTDIARAVMCVSLSFGESIHDDGRIDIQYDVRSSRTWLLRRRRSWPRWASPWEAGSIG